MPHKRNPITAERISGSPASCAGTRWPALEDVALWHERDISHSSVERVILPDAFLALDYMLAPHPDARGGPRRAARSACCEVLESSHGLVFSQRVLLGLVERGPARARTPTRWCSATRCARGTRRRPLGELLAADPEVTAHLTPRRARRRCSTPRGTPGTCPS